MAETTPQSAPESPAGAPAPATAAASPTATETDAGAEAVPTIEEALVDLAEYILLLPPPPSRALRARDAFVQKVTAIAADAGLDEDDGDAEQEPQAES